MQTENFEICLVIYSLQIGYKYRTFNWSIKVGIVKERQFCSFLISTSRFRSNYWRYDYCYLDLTRSLYIIVDGKLIIVFKNTFPVYSTITSNNFLFLPITSFQSISKGTFRLNAQPKSIIDSVFLTPLIWSIFS